MTGGRTIGGVLAATVCLSLAYAGGWPLAVAVSILSLAALLELRWVAARSRLRLSLEVGYAVCVAYVFAAYWFADDLENLGIALLALTCFMVLVDFALHLHHGISAPTSNVSLTAFACIWCGLMASCLVLVRGCQPDLVASTVFGADWPLGRRLLLYLIAVNLCADGAAYLADELAGRRHLATTVKPDRTVEGLLAAIIVAAVASLLFGWLLRVEALPAEGLPPEAVHWLSLKHRLVLGLFIGVAGRLGEFGAHIFKHEAGVPHYSAIAPGRAGLLDRTASLLMAAPVVYLYAQLAL